MLILCRMDSGLHERSCPTCGCEVVGWRPIETAPKTKGSRILAWDGHEMLTLDYVGPSKIGIHDHITVGDWWVQVSDSGRSSVYYPTHWMPLPSAPEPPGGAE